MNEWISVKDRLPEYTKAVLALRKDGMLFIGYRPDKSGWCAGAIEFCDRVTSVWSVTHWQPLPEPPEPKKPFRTRNINGVSCIHLFEGDRCQEVVGYFLDEPLARDVVDRLNEIWEKRTEPPKMPELPRFEIRISAGIPMLYFYEKDDDGRLSSWFPLDLIEREQDRFIAWINGAIKKCQP